MYSVRKKGYAIQYIIVYKINISFNISLFTKLIFNKSMNMNILRNHYIVESICSFVQELINRSIIINKKPRPGYIPHVQPATNIRKACCLGSFQINLTLQNSRNSVIPVLWPLTKPLEPSCLSCERIITYHLSSERWHLSF